MLKEETMLQESLDKMNDIFRNAFQGLQCELNDYLASLSWPDGEDYSLIALVRDNARHLNRMIAGLNIAKDYQKMMETYLDVSICLKACSMRQFQEREMTECQKILAINRYARLTPRQKDLAYLGCTLENIIKSKSLEDYRKYKKYYCELLGL